MARDKALAPFNLAHDPLFRVEIIRCSDTDHVLMLTIHHLAFDAWSEELITSELASLYAAFASGTPPLLPELPIQYADFARWQREWMTSEDFEIQRTYWEQQLRDAPALLTLPLDHPRAAKQTFRGSTETLLLSEPLTQRIHLLCRQHQVTPYMLMLAAFGVVLARYSGQDDVCIGTSIANRSRPETEQLVGFLVNTLVLRIRLEENPRFKELLRRVSDVASSAYAHQDMPFEKLVELLGVQRNLPYTPLFQVLFVMVNMPDTEDFNLPGVRLEPFDFDMKLARFDLTLRISEPNGKQAFQCDLEYNTDLFLQSTIVRMLHHYQTLLESVATRPEARLSELSMLSDAQRRQLLIEWNEPRRDDFQERCIHELFEAHVRQDYAADAVMYEGRRLSYQELDTKANRLARYLQSLGVRPEVKVGLCLERSLDLIVGMFAVLKAGGVYIPLDPKFPADRLGYMLSDSGTRIVLTQTQWSDLLPETEVEQVCLDRDWPMIAAHPEDAPVSAVRPGNLAYIIYTSGSTGRPKGVAIEHRQLTNYVSGLLERLTLDRDSSFATISTVAADLGNTAIFGALCSGRSLHVLSVDRGFDPNAVAEYMEEHRIDVLKIVPGHLAGLLEASRPERVLPRRCLILGGEAVHQSLVERVRALAPDCEIINHYGPTETTVGVLTHRIGREIDGHSTIPIGRPLL
ncbi:MAG TPA: condensation domain-containing protein, partial [Nitrospira sp.]|nr:condensation domain-containing protein [Nitrospira sp.]